MDSLFLGGVSVATTLVLAAFAIVVLRLPIRAARPAGAALLEFVALWVLCLSANLAFGFLVVVLVRSFTARFISIYLVNDVSVVLISALQAFAAHAWIRSSRP